MDRLDHAAEALVERCVLGHETTFRRVADHAVIATWVTLVSLLMTQIQGESAFSAERYREFGSTREPFAGTYVWLAATVKPPELALKTNGFPRSGTTPGGDRMHFSTFRINHLVVQAFIPPQPMPELSFERGPLNRGFVRQIWPSPLMPVSWPPAQILSESDLAEFSETFLDEPNGG